MPDRSHIPTPQPTPGYVPGLPSWDDLLVIVRGSMPHRVLGEEAIARNITTGVHMHVEAKIRESRAAWKCLQCRAWPDDPSFDPDAACWRCPVCGTQLTEGVR